MALPGQSFRTVIVNGCAWKPNQRNQPAQKNIHFFNSEFPSQWSEESYKEFVTAVENFATRRAKYHLQNWTRVTGRKKFVEVEKNVD